MTTRYIKASRLEEGMKLVLPFGKSATILSDPLVGRSFVTFRTEWGKSRVSIYDEIAIESGPEGKLD